MRVVEGDADPTLISAQFHNDVPDDMYTDDDLELVSQVTQIIMDNAMVLEVRNNFSFNKA